MWRDQFPPAPTNLERYAARFNCAEINSSFYRQHRFSTYARWGATVPADFRFAVKVPRAITHDQRLIATDVLLEVFLEEVAGLGDRLGPLLVQLPPSLSYEAAVTAEFLATLRTLFTGDVVCEPRHQSWFTGDADALLATWRVSRAGADPACHARAALPGGDPALAYFRLHGSPVMYRSNYSQPFLQGVAERLRASSAAGAPCWCVFDNTTLGAATGNALELAQLPGSQPCGRPGAARR
ncbi:MAG: DUF72 domain-containing protein [Gemmatimonadota bacterium]|nr:DUF72 domain-containing protein [Gemmatimonadota bacterium]